MPYYTIRVTHSPARTCDVDYPRYFSRWGRNRLLRFFKTKYPDAQRWEVGLADNITVILKGGRR